MDCWYTVIPVCESKRLLRKTTWYFYLHFSVIFVLRNMPQQSGRLLSPAVWTWKTGWPLSCTVSLLITNLYVCIWINLFHLGSITLIIKTRYCKHVNINIFQQKKMVQSLWLSHSKHNKSFNTVVTYVYVQISKCSPSPAFLPFLTQEHPNISALMTLRSHAAPHIPNTSVFLPAADGRHGIVRVDRVPLACKLVDLPCMIESLKTVDKKTFYKTADVCQVNRCPGN